MGTTFLPPAVLVVEDNADMRETLSDALALLGSSTCVAVASLRELEARRTEALACNLAIVDINLGPMEPTGIDVFHWLRRSEFGGKIVFLTGHAADDPRVMEATALESSELYAKPLKLAELGRLVSTVVGS